MGDMISFGAFTRHLDGNGVRILSLNRSIYYATYSKEIWISYSLEYSYELCRHP